MPHNPADDVPAPSVQESPVLHSAVTCPDDRSMVMVSGERGDAFLYGFCQVCHQLLEGDASLVSQIGKVVTQQHEEK